METDTEAEEELGNREQKESVKATEKNDVDV